MFNILNVTKYSYLDCIQIVFDCLLTKFIGILIDWTNPKMWFELYKKY